MNKYANWVLIGGGGSSDLSYGLVGPGPKTRGSG